MLRRPLSVSQRAIVNPSSISPSIKALAMICPQARSAEMSELTDGTRIRLSVKVFTVSNQVVVGIVVCTKNIAPIKDIVGNKKIRVITPSHQNKFCLPPPIGGGLGWGVPAIAAARSFPVVLERQLGLFVALARLALQPGLQRGARRLCRNSSMLFLGAERNTIAALTQ